jgi:Asp-tRNA(Asn)/Glu-tRNA(Gln) amidotransferase A subunit family amidase
VRPQTVSDDAWALAAAIRRGETSAAQVVRASLDRIADRDELVNAFTVVTADAALAQAAEVDTGRRSGPLAGVPISVKDHVWVRGLPATNGSRALADFVPDADCACVARLVAAGAIIVGKTNNPEFCYRGVTDNELFGATRNPADPGRTAGGSSGGAAASVAAGMVPLAIGTDGGGSIRIPSAFCGCYGLKPSFGLVPKLPGFRGWPTLSATGPVAESARDLALALTVLAGPSPLDPLSLAAPAADYLAATADPSWRGRRVAVSEDLGFAAVDPDVRAAFRSAVAVIADAGAEVVEACPEPIDPTPLWEAVALPEGYASEGPLVEQHPELVGADAAAIALAGRDVTAREYLDAQHARGRLVEAWDRFLVDVDVVLTPAMPVTAFELGRLGPATIAGAPVPASFDEWCALALPANLAGLPAASVPMGAGRDGLPVGLQIVGRRLDDIRVLRAAAAFARVQPFRRPPAPCGRSTTP